MPTSPILFECCPDYLDHIGKNRTDIPCLTLTYLEFRAATKLACGSESSSENSSSLVTVLERVFSTALDPIGLKYCPLRSLRASWPLWYSALKRQSFVQVSTNFPEEKKYQKLTSSQFYFIGISFLCH